MTATLPKQKNPDQSPKEQRRAFAGMLVRKECWTLSLTARIIVLICLIGAVWGGIRFIHPFLATTNRTNGGVLVVEAWIPRYGLEQAVAVYKAGGYRKMVASGCSRLDDLSGRTTLSPAEAAAVELGRYGMGAGSVAAIPCRAEKKDRTYNTALAVKEWLGQSGMTVTSIDVLTLGPHARRSRLLFQKAFGSQVKVGVIAIEDRSYDPAHWWQSSEGVREVIGEGIAYLYARILFHPSEPTPPAHFVEKRSANADSR
ncbi:MAG TPA: ElyC/SanA/YdcF family protein [Verrucomicrobiae bacterium]|nr:ElyC/SanA/YdcF family protein [Verrucomicrobiae bacterium]